MVRDKFLLVDAIDKLFLNLILLIFGVKQIFKYFLMSKLIREKLPSFTEHPDKMQAI